MYFDIGANAGFVPYAPQTMYTQRGFGYYGGQADDTGTMHHNGFFVVSPVLSAMTRMLNLTDTIVFVQNAALVPQQGKESSNLDADGKIRAG